MVDVTSAGVHQHTPSWVKAWFQAICNFGKLLLLNFRANWLLWVLVACFIGYVRWQTSYLPGHQAVSFGRLVSSFFLVALPLFGVALIIERLIYMVVVVRPESPIRELWRMLTSFFRNPMRMSNGITTMVLTFLFANYFGQMKIQIPKINPFQWDETFMWLDRALHFGFDPWVILQPLLGFWQVTVFFDWMYWVWLLVIYSVWVIAAFSHQHTILRTQFLLSFFLIWAIVGSIMAPLLSSAGPVFYANLGLSPDPYTGLMQYLASVNETYPLMAQRTKELLWLNYIGEGGRVGGITAMPSMHNCTSMLIAIYGWHLNRKLGICLSIFAFIIFLGSIHLGWHYAVDAYVAGIMAGLIWVIAGRVAKWMHGRKASKDYKEFGALISD